jgi:hypothetical protein
MMTCITARLISIQKNNRHERSQQIFLKKRQTSLRHPGSGFFIEINAPSPLEFQQKIQELGLGDYY